MDEHPGHERRAVRAQLRTHLDEAAAHSSMREAVASLGSARALAQEYIAALPPGRVRWALGLSWATGWLLLCLVALAVFASALAQVAPDLPGGASARLLWTEVTVVRSADAASLEVTSTVPWGLVGAAALFVTTLRLWRVLPGRRREPVGA
ncbi:HAAS signaling domain-containing protein [Georgenia muralis]